MHQLIKKLNRAKSRKVLPETDEQYSARMRSLRPTDDQVFSRLIRIAKCSKALFAWIRFELRLGVTPAAPELPPALPHNTPVAPLEELALFVNIPPSLFSAISLARAPTSKKLNPPTIEGRAVRPAVAFEARLRRMQAIDPRGYFAGGAACLVRVPSAGISQLVERNGRLASWQEYNEELEPLPTFVVVSESKTEK